MKSNKRMILFILSVLLFSNSCKNKNEFLIKAKLVNPPLSTFQLAPAIFLPESYVEKLSIEEGVPVRVIHGKEKEDLRIYKFFGEEGTFAVHKKFADKLKLKYGDVNQIKIEKIQPEETKLEPKPIKFYVENYKGDLKKWKGYAFGAPHGDCDFETGSVVKLVAKNYGIPATAAYGCRISYRGIWFDCNRPLMKKPKPDGHGVFPERNWNEAAEEKYKTYQDSVWKNNGLHYGERFELFTSFHGHDLTVKLPDGRKIERPVIEAIGVGFTKNELRKIKKFYYQNANRYWENPPDLYFGNLPEDRTYEQFGEKLQFFYSGLGTRTYGSLRSDLCKHALHFETPNSVRLEESVRPATANFLADLYSFIRREILGKENSFDVKIQVVTPPKDVNAKIKIPAGVFIMGAPENEGWSSEHPQHKVFVDEFEIDKYEVTNQRYAKFLNDAIKQGLINISDGKVFDKSKHLLYDVSNPFSEIKFENGKFYIKKHREFFPVVFVTYYGAKAFAEFYGGDLPTEAEWEKAATWNGKRKFFYSVSSDKIKESMANFEDSGDPFEKVFPGSTPVGFYKSSSPYGVKDMSGNVWEWCKDTYVYSAYKNLKDTVIANPFSDIEGTMKTIRGGAWNTEFYVTRGTMRLGINPNQGLVNLGFRCVYRKNK